MSIVLNVPIRLAISHLQIKNVEIAYSGRDGVQL